MRTMWVRGAAALAAMMVVTTPTHAAPFYVDMSWTGTPAGTATEPFTTIKAAVDAANPIAGTDEIDIFIAAGIYADEASGGEENFSAGGGPDGGIYITRRFINIHGGYAGWDGEGAEPENFDWTEGSRVPRTTIIDLKDADSRAFYHEPPAGRGALFDGLMFQNASHAANGGALCSPHVVHGRNLFVRNCLFTNNVVTAADGYGGALWVASREGLSWFHDSDFVDNSAGFGGAMSVNNVYDGSVEIENCTFLGNHAAARGGAIYFVAFGGGTGIQLIRGSHFESNTAALLGGAIMSPDAGVRVERSVFTQNAAPSGAALGGVTGTQSWGCSYYLENCLIYRNTGGYAVEQDGPRLTDYSVDILHCTIVENPGGGVKFRDRSDSRPARIRNSIIAFNGNYGIYRVDDDDVYIFSHNNVFDNTNDYFNCAADDDSIAVDPLFIDADAGNFRLNIASPLIDAGAHDTGNTLDIKSVPRPTRNGFDMGAFEEWQIPIIENRAVLAQSDEAEVRAEFVYESADIATDAWFVLGTLDPGTDDMADWWQSAPAGEQLQDIIFGATFFGLSPDTDYVYRCVSSNNYDMFWGPVGTFKTGPAGGVMRLWTGLAGDGLASNPANWDGSTIPSDADYIVLDTEPANMTWNAGTGDLPDTVASWTQTENYAGTVSLTGTLTVKDRMTVNGGILQTEKDAVSGFHVADRLSIGTQGTVLVRRSSTTVTDAWGEPVGAGQTITAGSAVIDGLLSADVQGFNTGQGPAFGDINRGGSHGGQGAGNTLDTTYGSVTNPTALGSGGRTGGDNTATGGGAILLAVSGHLAVNGAIGADGSHTGQDRRGAGGSINITAGTLSGSGTIRANGGGTGATTAHRAGGGGRVALELSSGADVGNVAIQAFGGVGSADGGAGTVYIKHTGHGVGRGELMVDNDGRPARRKPHNAVLQAFTHLSKGGDDLGAYAGVTVRNQGNLAIRGDDTMDFATTSITGSGVANSTVSIAGTNGVSFPSTFQLPTDYTLCIDVPLTHANGNWTIPDGAVLAHNHNGADVAYYLQLAVSNLTIAQHGAIDLDQRGYGHTTTAPGSGDDNRGASYGGGGGTATSGTSPAPTYGSILNPIHMGSNSRTRTGGGAVILTVDNALVLDGIISANGEDAWDRLGSGGAVNIKAGTLSGGGTIRANGGNGFMGGGGGRIAVRLKLGTDFGSVDFEAFGGTGDGADRRAAAGTIYRQTALENNGFGTVLLDNRDQIPTANAFASLPAFPTATEDLAATRWTAQNRGRVGLTADAEIGSLELGTQGYLELAGYSVTVARLTIDGEYVRWGNYQAGDPALGSRVTDAIGGGWVVIPPPPRGTLMLIR